MLHRITQQTSVSYPFFYRNLMIINHFFSILHTFLKQNPPTTSQNLFKFVKLQATTKKQEIPIYPAYFTVTY